MDLSDPTTPAVAQNWLAVAPNRRPPTRVVVDQETLLVASSEEVFRWDPPATPESILDAGSSIRDLQLEDGLVYLLVDTELRVYDSTDLSTPTWSWVVPATDSGNRRDLQIHSDFIAVRAGGELYAGQLGQELTLISDLAFAYLLRDESVLISQGTSIVEIPLG